MNPLRAGVITRSIPGYVQNVIRLTVQDFQDCFRRTVWTITIRACGLQEVLMEAMDQGDIHEVVTLHGVVMNLRQQQEAAGRTRDGIMFHNGKC